MVVSEANLGICETCGQPLQTAAADGLCQVCLLGLASNPASTDWTPAPADQLNGRMPGLDVIRLLGRGGMGAVYLAKQQRLDRLVAVKVFPPAWADDPVLVARFLREARLLAKVQHPHIVTVFDANQDDVLLYLVMEYVEGPTLREAMAAGPLAASRALRLMSQICDAVGFAHEQGVAHRDLKPENILLAGDAFAKVTDFGLARLIDSQGEPALSQDWSLTLPMHRVGTVHYMAPEQLQETDPGDAASSEASAGARSDVYSLGVIFYEMLTGMRPLGAFRPVSQVVAAPAATDTLIARMLAPSPRDRLASAAEAATALQGSHRDQPEGAGAGRDGDGRQRPGQQHGRRNGQVFLTACLGVAAVLLVMAVAFRPALFPTTSQGPQTTVPPVVDEPDDPPALPATTDEPKPIAYPRLPLPPEPINPGAPVNSPSVETYPHLSADGLSLYFVRWHREVADHSGRFDVYQARRAAVDQPFESVRRLGKTINTAAEEISPSLTADELTVVFSRVRSPSERPVMLLAKRSSQAEPFGEPTVLVEPPAGAGDHIQPLGQLMRDGLTLVVSYHRAIDAKKPEGFDLSQLPYWVWLNRASRDDPFGEPEPAPLDPALLPQVEAMVLSEDRLKLLLDFRDSSNRDQDIWIAQRDDVREPFGMPTRLAAPINTDYKEVPASLSADCRLLVFWSNRAGGAGKPGDVPSRDIWFAALP